MPEMLTRAIGLTAVAVLLLVVWFTWFTWPVERLSNQWIPEHGADVAQWPCQRHTDKVIGYVPFGEPCPAGWTALGNYQEVLDRRARRLPDIVPASVLNPSDVRTCGESLTLASFIRQYGGCHDAEQEPLPLRSGALYYEFCPPGMDTEFSAIAVAAEIRTAGHTHPKFSRAIVACSPR